MKYHLGLDLGITSIGWALFRADDDNNPIRIENLGVRIFNSLEDEKGKLENQHRREKRGQRRIRRRKQGRLNKAKELFKKEFGIEFTEIEFKKYSNPYELKIKGLKKELSKEELMIALYHYCKYRGFKSNRKVEDYKKEGKLLSFLNDVSQKLISNNITITEYLYNNFINKDIKNRRIHNSDNEYIFNATRQMYLDEINQLLDNQIKYENITNEFKEEYIKIFSHQISYSVGPGYPSKWGAQNEKTLIAKMIGTCKFDGKQRAGKGSFTAESFVLLSLLNNISFKENNLYSNYRRFTREEIKEIYDYAKKNKKLTYNKIFTYLKLNVVKVKGLDLSKKKYKAVLEGFKKQNNISESESLSSEMYERFLKYSLKELFNTTLPSLTVYHEQLSVLNKINDVEIKEEVENFKKDYKNFDRLSEILLENKTDEEIKKKLIKSGYSEKLSEALLNCDDITKTINLSLDLCDELNKYLLDGNTYDNAMELCGYNHNNSNMITDKYEFLPSIEECLERINEYMPNPVVHHALVEMRKLLNSIIKKYGYISKINIEVARELALSHKMRKEVENEQKENAENNINLKFQILKKYPHCFKGLNQINKDVLDKYKLYQEQAGKCAYSNTRIPENMLFDDGYCQIDHIMPYSRTFEDRYFNKALVLTKLNQEKKNKLPYEAFANTDNWNKIIDFLNDKDIRISSRKREVILMRTLDENEWKERNLNDTKYISKLSRKIILQFLKPEKCDAIPGMMTDFIKKYYGLNRFTHSYISENYIIPKDCKLLINNDETIGDSKINMIINSHGEEKLLKIEKIKEKKNMSQEEKNLNSAIDYFNKNPDKFFEVYNMITKNGIEYINIVLENANLISKSNDVNQNELYNKMSTILSLVQKEIIAEKKNRNNHLHHVLDACAIAIANGKTEYRIQKWAQTRETMVDQETGEIVPSVKLELPYKDYVNDVKIRIYERDYDRLISGLKGLNCYKDCLFEKENIYVVEPSRSVNKNITGAFTKEKMYARRKETILKKVDVKEYFGSYKNNKEKEKKLNEIYNESNGQKSIIESIRKWMDDPKESRTEWPVLISKGNYIKKVRIIETENPERRVKLKQDPNNNIYGENTDVIRIDVYKEKNGSDSLLMIPIYYFQLVKEKINQEVYYEIMYNSGKDGSKYVTKKSLEEGYDLVCRMPKHSLVEVEHSNGGRALCYSVGLSKGNFEVRSVLGDNYDLYNGKLIKSANIDRIRISVSTIKSIKVHNISILGKVN